MYWKTQEVRPAVVIQLSASEVEQLFTELEQSMHIDDKQLPVLSEFIAVLKEAQPT